MAKSFQTQWADSHAASTHTLRPRHLAASPAGEEAAHGLAF